MSVGLPPTPDEMAFLARLKDVVVAALKVWPEETVRRMFSRVPASEWAIRSLTSGQLLNNAPVADDAEVAYHIRLDEWIIGEDLE